MTGSQSNEHIPMDLNYVYKMLYVCGFDKEFVARDLGIKLDSLERRIERAKERGEW